MKVNFYFSIFHTKARPSSCARNSRTKETRVQYVADQTLPPEAPLTKCTRNYSSILSAIGTATNRTNLTNARSRVLTLVGGFRTLRPTTFGTNTQTYCHRRQQEECIYMCLRLSLAPDLYGSGTAQWIVRHWQREIKSVLATGFIWRDLHGRERERKRERKGGGHTLRSHNNMPTTLCHVRTLHLVLWWRHVLSILEGDRHWLKQKK
jgi:hypothetical protein